MRLRVIEVWLLITAACGARTGLSEMVADAGHTDSGIPSGTELQLALGNQHSCLRINGQVWCWGENGHGELGDGTMVTRPTPARVVGMSTARIIASGDAVDIDAPPNMPARGSHTCAVLADSSLVCWGSNVEGYIDQSNPVSTLSPKPIAIESSIGIAVDGRESCAIDSTKSVQCWGWASDGALGDGSFTGPSPRGPVSVVGQTSVVEVAAANDAACAVHDDGTVWCWGLDNIGELGDGHDGLGVQSAVPVQTAVDHVVHVSGGWSDVCALRDDGHALCWGDNEAGQIGNGSASPDVPTPTLVPLDDIEQIVTNGNHTCAVRIDQTLWCWGNAEDGRLGIGSNSGTVLMPTRVNLQGVAQVALGWHHTCARCTDNSVWCWGSNESGEVGDGTSIERDVPKRVVGLP